MGFRPTRFPTMPAKARSAGTISSIGAATNMPASAPARMAVSTSTARGTRPPPRSARSRGRFSGLEPRCRPGESLRSQGRQMYLPLPLADHALGDQRVDLALGIAELAKHLGRMLGKFRRDAPQARFGPIHPDRRGDALVP